MRRALEQFDYTTDPSEQHPAGEPRHVEPGDPVTGANDNRLELWAAKGLVGPDEQE